MWVFLALTLLPFHLALAAKAPVTAPDPYREFVAACVTAFDLSSGNGSDGIGKQICECTAKESRHQGTTVAAIRAETKRIQADPKRQIQDVHLLDSLHYCALTLLHNDS